MVSAHGRHVSAVPVPVTCAHTHYKLSAVSSAFMHHYGPTLLLSLFMFMITCQDCLEPGVAYGVEMRASSASIHLELSVVCLLSHDQLSREVGAY